MEDKELNSCTFAKTLLMLMVVFGHSCAFWSGGWFSFIKPIYESSTIGEIGPFLGTFHTSAFTLLSGYIYYFIRFEKGRYESFGQFIKNKFKRLVLPYIIISVIWVLPVESVFKDLTLSDIVYRFIVAVSPCQLWFLIMLFGVFVFFYVVSNIVRRHITLSILFFVLLYFIGSVLDKYIPNIFQIHNIFKFSLFFCIGFVLRHLDLRPSNKTLMTCFVLSLMLNILTYFYLSDLIIGNTIICAIGRVGCNCICSVAGVFMSISMLFLISRHCEWNNRFFKFASKYSFMIYLFHQQIIYFTIIAFNGQMIPTLHVLVNFIIATFSSIAISFMITKINCFSFMLNEK